VFKYTYEYIKKRCKITVHTHLLSHM